MIQRPLYVGIMYSFGLILFGGVCAAGPADDGRKLAIEACSACHQVFPQQKRPPPVSEGEEGARTEAPTFTEIAHRCLSPGELKSRIANPHYPMREQILMPIDLDDLAVYIQSLSTPTDCAIR
jgi:hypothetical protein